MKILHLTVKKRWFDMLRRGEKKEEYRLLKSYWTKRIGSIVFYEAEADEYKVERRRFDIVRFRNGYSKDAPELDIEFKSIYISTGREDWGAEPGRLYYVIRLGKVLAMRHCPVAIEIRTGDKTYRHDKEK